MKKFVAIILLLLYSTANFGLSMRLDYCGERLSDIAFYSGEKQLSECCIMMGLDEDCCNSEQIFLQEDSDKIQKTTSDENIQVVAIMQPIPGTEFITSLKKEARLFCLQADSPPKKVRLHVEHACFLI